MKKTIIGTISGAVIGAVIASVITVHTIGYFPASRENAVKIIAGADVKEDIKLLTEGTVKTPLSVEEIAKHVGPSIVGVTCISNVQSFFGMQQAESLGSGIIIDSAGYIITNHHVIEDCSEVKVNLTNGKSYNAELVGSDEKTDIAVIKISAETALPTAKIGNSDIVEVGELAVAIGNPLASELLGTVTAGVISGVNRTITVGNRDMTLIQTDAAISPGNSGGALINKYGEVIGINSVKLVDNAAEGLGFAIPINEAVPIVNDLRSHGYVKGRPMVGVSIREITKELAYYNNLLVDYGLYVMDITEGSGAEKAGIQKGDIIIKVDGQIVKTLGEMNKIRDTHKAGEKMNVTVVRAGKELTLVVTLTEDLSGKK